MPQYTGLGKHNIIGFVAVVNVWTTPTASKVAWFKDPDGNILSISEHPEWKTKV